MKQLPLDIVLNNAKQQMDTDDFESMKVQIIEDHYIDIESEVKAGGKISKQVFDSLEPNKQWHFMKHYPKQLED